VTRMATWCDRQHRPRWVTPWQCSSATTLAAHKTTSPWLSLGGAFTNWDDRAGSIEDGDIEEAFFGMAAAGDPTPQPTGDRWIDARHARRLTRQAHGTREQRMQNFRTGLDGGPSACVRELQGRADQQELGSDSNYES
jgi:hypothetical protein